MVNLSSQPELLEAWLGLSSVNYCMYHRNIGLVLLNRWLALTMLQELIPGCHSAGHSMHREVNLIIFIYYFLHLINNLLFLN